MVIPLQTHAQNDKQDDIFEHIVLGDHPTLYEFTQNIPQSIEIIAHGQNSASGLYTKNINHIAPNYPKFKWSWKVDKIQSAADISIKDKEDFAASIQIVFGSNSLFKHSKVLTYAWIGSDTAINAVIKSPRIPNHFRTIIIGNQTTSLNKWHQHTRDIREDYKTAYGKYPDRDINAIGIFTDNDQTQQPVSASYRLHPSAKQ